MALRQGSTPPSGLLAVGLAGARPGNYWTSYNAQLLLAMSHSVVLPLSVCNFVFLKKMLFRPDIGLLISLMDAFILCTSIKKLDSRSQCLTAPFLLSS